MSLATPALFAVDTPATATHQPWHWFAVYTRPNHEKKVAEQFRLRNIESYLPSYRALRRWKNGCAVMLELPLFPGYLFVHIARGERVRVLEVAGVISIVGKGHEPAPLADFELESLRTGLRQRAAVPHPFLHVGEKARIRCGPLQGMEGIVAREKNSSHKMRVILTLDIIMKSVAVEVSGEELEYLGHGDSRREIQDKGCPAHSHAARWPVWKAC
ncbi:MAG: UpxY family transcription antiterminator [Terriglobales bacterium]